MIYFLKYTTNTGLPLRTKINLATKVKRPKLRVTLKISLSYKEERTRVKRNKRVCATSATYAVNAAPIKINLHVHLQNLEKKNNSNQ